MARTKSIFEPAKAPEYDLGAVWTQTIEYTDGRLEYRRDTAPRFAAPVTIDDAGEYHLDRNNVVWLDDIADDEKQQLLDQYDDPKQLKFVFSRMKD